MLFRGCGDSGGAGAPCVDGKARCEALRARALPPSVARCGAFVRRTSASQAIWLFQVWGMLVSSHCHVSSKSTNPLRWFPFGARITRLVGSLGVVTGVGRTFYMCIVLHMSTFKVVSGRVPSFLGSKRCNRLSTACPPFMPRYRVTGMTWEELWDKYEKKILAEDPSLEGEDLKTSVCLRILEKSCSTSEVFNNLSGCSELNTFLPDTFCPAGTVSTPELQEACAHESAAACAGAIRLIPLIQPFKRAQLQSDETVIVRKRARRHARRRRMIAGRRRFSRRGRNRPRTTTA